MKRRAKADMKDLKVTFEAVAGRQGGRGIFAIEDAAEEIARRTKLAHNDEIGDDEIGGVAVLVAFHTSPQHRHHLRRRQPTTHAGQQERHV
jgi:hypothetical protein